MKKLLLMCLLGLCINAKLSAQNLPQYDNIRLEAKEDYKQADSVVMLATNYILSTPIDKTNTGRLKSMQFLIKWMTGTPDYSFSLDENTVKYFVNDADLMGTYMAALSKSALQNKPGTDNKTLTLNAVKMLLAYVNNANNNVTVTKPLKKLSEANDNGQLASFLKL